MSTQLIRGDKLPAKARDAVLRAYTHRWTHENAQQTYGGKCPACEQAKRNGVVTTGTKDAPKIWPISEWHAYHAPLTTDAEWLKEHAFYVKRDGGLDSRRKHAEPVYLVD